MGILVPSGPMGPDTTAAGSDAISGENVFIDGKAFTVNGPATFEPEYVSNIETDVTANTDAITDNCGRTEVRKNGDSNWTISVEGIISDAQLSQFKNVARLSETFTVSSKAYAGPAVTDSATIIEKDEDVYIEFPGGGTDGMAIHFQLQMKEPKSQYGGGVVPNFS